MKNCMSTNIDFVDLNKVRLSNFLFLNAAFLMKILINKLILGFEVNNRWSYQKLFVYIMTFDDIKKFKMNKKIEFIMNY